MSAFQEYATAFEHLRNLAAWISLPNTDVATNIFLEGLERSLTLLEDCEHTEPLAQKSACQRIRAHTQALMIELQNIAEAPEQHHVIVQRTETWVDSVARDLMIWEANERGLRPSENRP